MPAELSEFAFYFYGAAAVRKPCAGWNGTAGVSGTAPALGVLRQIQKLIWIVPEVLCAAAEALTAAGGGTAINHRVPLLH